MAEEVPDAAADRHRVVVLDGATGTELGRRGLDTRSPLFSSVALLTSEGRRVLRELHLEYLRAGADIVTAATFRTNRRALEAAGQGSRFPELAEAAVAEARAARDEHGSGLVAGSLAPLEYCYQPEKRPVAEAMFAEHLEHARALAMAGCDLLLVETIASGEEGITAVEAASSMGLPVCASTQLTPEGKLLDGSDPREFFGAAVGAGAGAVPSTASLPTGSTPFSTQPLPPAFPSGPTPTWAKWTRRSAGRARRCSSRTPTPTARLAGSRRERR